MKSGARVALGVGAGYLLGRTRKMRLALMLAAAGANGRAGAGPRHLLQEGVSKLGSSGELRELTDTVRGDLLTAAKAAAVTAASNRIDALSDRLQATQQQAVGQETEPREEAEPESPEDAEQQAEAEESEPEEPEPEEQEPEEQPRSTTRRRTTTPRRSEPRTRDESGDERGTTRRRGGGTATSTRRAPVRRTRR